jgi:hypothetical protein
MSPLRIHQVRLLGQAVLWLAATIALGVAFGDSLAAAAGWVVASVIVGLVVGNRRAIAAWIRTRRRAR